MKLIGKLWFISCLFEDTGCEETGLSLFDWSLAIFPGKGTFNVQHYSSAFYYTWEQTTPDHGIGAARNQWKLLAINGSCSQSAGQLFSTQTGALLLRPADPYFLASGFPKFIDICSEAPALFWLVAKNSPNFKKPTLNYHQTICW